MSNFRILFLVALSAIGGHLCIAQSTILNQTLLTDESFNMFTPVSVTGTQTWFQHDVYGAVCSGYSGQSFENEDWLISPAMNLMEIDNVTLTFSHTRGNAAVVNVGVEEGWYKVFATADYTGDPSTTTWVELSGLNQTVPEAWQYVPSGALIIPDVAKSTVSRIAFRYISSAAQSATWEIRNVKVTGEPQGSPGSGTFKITNWNVEWLGCTQNGPTDEDLQISNVAEAMLAMDSDIYCIQEVTNTQAALTIESLLPLMGGGWDGYIVPNTTADCDQRQAIIYKNSRVHFAGAALMGTGDAAQGNSYYYNWANGRYPALYEVNLVVGDNLVPVSLVNIHAKAEDGNAMSYTRRLGGSEALKTILDGPEYNTRNVIVIGDFNDYLLGTSSTACDCSDSPYKNFVDDNSNYTGVTAGLTDANWSQPLIEHIVVSNELIGNYVANSAAQDVAVTQNIPNYYGTTSHHFPVTATFDFTVLSNPEFATKAWKLYPNPVQSELKYDLTGENGEPAIYDITGRQMDCQQIAPGTVDVAGLPVGIYILKVGSFYGRFVKE